MNSKHTYNLFFLAISILFTACGGSTQKEQSADTTTTAEASCLAELIPTNEIEKMISTEQLAAIVDLPKESLTYSESKSSSSKYSTFGYDWKPDTERIIVMEMTVGDRTISNEMALDNQVDIGNLGVLEPKNKTPLAHFDFIYGPKTAEQKEKSKQAIDRATKGESIDERSAESLKAMVDKESPSKKLADVGDSAYWSEEKASGMVYVSLIVLDGNTTFKITTDVSDDTQEDLRISKAIAQQIVANCAS